MIKLLQVIEEAESMALHSANIYEFAPAFKDLRNNKIYLTGMFHDVDGLPENILKVWEDEEDKNRPDKTIIDGFWSKKLKKFFTRDEVDELLKKRNIQESKSISFLDYKFTSGSALLIVQKILKELPKEYTKGLKIKFGNKIQGEDNAYYDKYSDTIVLGKDLFTERSDDFDYWYKYFNSLSERERKKHTMTLERDNNYGLTGKQIGYENLRNIIYHEIGHRVDYNNEQRKKYSRLKPKNTSTINRYASYYAGREEELDLGRPIPLYKRRMEAEQFAENFRMYWIRKNK